MNILLIYPEFPDTFWSFKWILKFIRKKATILPLGMATIAAMFPKKWNLKIVDMNVAKLEKKDIEWADCIFTGGMTIQKKSILQIIKICKKAGKLIVGGGPIFTMNHDHVDFKLIDHFVLGEAELSLYEFLKDFKKGRARRVYKSKPGVFPDLKNSPIPRFDLLDLSKYASAGIQYSRGCPWNCDFCDITSQHGHKVRTKTAKQIITELNYLYYKLGWRGRIFIVDDNLIGNKKRFKRELLPTLIKWVDGKNIVFNIQASIDLADDDEMVRSMVRAHIDMAFIGIETPNDDSLAGCGKKQNRNRDLVADVKKLQRLGLQVQGGFIIGFDEDTESIFQRIIDFIQESGVVTAMISILQAPPGTELYKRLLREGRIICEWDGDIKYGSNMKHRMDRKVLIEGYDMILRSIYAPKPFYERVRTFLREYKPPPRTQYPIQFSDIIAGVGSFISLGIVNKGQTEYLKFIAWTLLTHRRSLLDAATLAIYGHHFRKTYKI